MRPLMVLLGLAIAILVFVLVRDFTGADLDAVDRESPSAGEPASPLPALTGNPAPESTNDAPDASVGSEAVRPGVSRLKVRLVDRLGGPVVDRETKISIQDADGKHLDRERVRVELVSLDTRGASVVRFVLESNEWHLADPSREARPGDDVRLVVVRGGRIEGLVLLPEGYPTQRLHVRASPMGSDDRGRYGTYRAESPFVISGLAEGSYRVELVRREAVLAVVDDVPVVFEQTTRDERLNPLDLGGRLARARITVLNESGVPLEGARVYVAGRAGRYSDVRTGIEGVAEIDVPAGGPVQIVVTQPGHEPEVVERVTGSVEVRLRIGIAVSLRASRAVKLDIGTHGAELLLRPDETKGPSWISDLRTGWGFGDGESHSFVFPGPGVYRLHVRVLQRMGSMFGISSGDRFIPTEATVEVRDVDGGASLVLEMPKDLFAYRKDAED